MEDRYYLSVMDKTEYEHIQNSDVLSFTKEYPNFKPDNLKTVRQLFNFYGDIDKQTIHALTQNKKPFFKSDYLQQQYGRDDSVFVKADREQLIDIIQAYKERVIRTLESTLTVQKMDLVFYGETISAEQKAKRYIEHRLNVWKNQDHNLLDLKQDTTALTTLKNTEYDTLTLVHILKTIDWANQILIIVQY